MPICVNKLRIFDIVFQCWNRAQRPVGFYVHSQVTDSFMNNGIEHLGYQKNTSLSNNK